MSRVSWELLWALESDMGVVVKRGLVGGVRRSNWGIGRV